MRAAILALCLIAGGCGLPRDASGTLARVRGGVLRVGIINSPPWVIDTGGEPRGVEATLAAGLARELGSTIQWTRAPEHALMRALHDRRLDLVIGDLDDALPWPAEAALTRPYYHDERRHVFAVPPGENAWLVQCERFLHAQEGRIGALLADAR